MNVLYERGVGIESENLVMGTGRSTQCDRGEGIKLGIWGQAGGRSPIGGAVIKLENQISRPGWGR